jgi:ABC-type transporter Mla subunit MlaD
VGSARKERIGVINEKLNRIVGLIMLFLLIAAVTVLLAMGDRPVVPVVHFTVEFSRVGQLRIGAPVKIANLEVGRVASIRFAAPRKNGRPANGAKTQANGAKTRKTDASGRVGRVLVSVWVRRKHRRFVRINSRFFISSASLIGARHLEIAPPREKPARMIRQGDTVYGEPPPHLDRMLLLTYQNLKLATELIEKLEPDMKAVSVRLAALRGNLETFRTYKPLLQHTMDNAKQAWRDFEGSAQQWNVVTRDGRWVTHLFERLERLSDRIRTRIEKLQTRAHHLETQLERVEANVKQMHIQARVKTVRRHIDRVASIARTALDNIETVKRALERGAGTVGALLHDRELYDDFKATQKKLLHQPWSPLARPRKMSVKGHPTP